MQLDQSDLSLEGQENHLIYSLNSRFCFCFCIGFVYRYITCFLLFVSNSFLYLFFVRRMEARVIFYKLFVYISSLLYTLGITLKSTLLNCSENRKMNSFQLHDLIIPVLVCDTAKSRFITPMTSSMNYEWQRPFDAALDNC